MISGGCLCGAVRFEIRRAVGPLEYCHCSRCRKASGAGRMAGLGVRREDFAWLSGTDAITTWEAPLLDVPPAWRNAFCSHCGAPVPDPEAAGDWFELPAGCLDDDPGLRPDRHIFVEHAAPWLPVDGELPRFTGADIRRARARGDT